MMLIRVSIDSRIKNRFLECSVFPSTGVSPVVNISLVIATTSQLEIFFEKPYGSYDSIIINYWTEDKKHFTLFIDRFSDIVTLISLPPGSKITYSFETGSMFDGVYYKNRAISEKFTANTCKKNFSSLE